MSRKGDQKIPVIIVTGFLGSGKTTILNRIIKHADMKATAIVINEFGEVGIDHMLVETSQEQMIEINNGCVCCTVRGDLADKLGALAMWLDTGRLPPMERVIIETTGLADPAPIMHTMMVEQTLLNRYRLSQVVTVVDSIAGRSSLGRFPEAVKQIAIADQIIMSKGDLIGTHSDRAEQALLRQRIKSINSRAEVQTSFNERRLIEQLKAEAEDQGQAESRSISNWISAARDDADYCGGLDHSHAPDASHESRHKRNDINTFVIHFGQVHDKSEFSDFLQDLMIEFGQHLLRMKGIVSVAEQPDTPAVVHGVQHVLFPVTWLDRWPDDDRNSKLVFIGEGIDKKSIEDRFARWSRSSH